MKILNIVLMLTRTMRPKEVYYVEYREGNCSGWWIWNTAPPDDAGNF